MSAEEFEALYKATAPELLGYLRRRGARDPEDMTAEVFTTAWRRRSDLPAAILRRAWLFGTARRLLLADGRLRDREHETVRGLTAEGAQTRTVHEEGERAAVVLAAVGRLPESDREILLLSEWEQLTPAEIAVVLGIKPGTARVRLHRARQALAADPELRRLLAPDLSAV